MPLGNCRLEITSIKEGGGGSPATDGSNLSLRYVTVATHIVSWVFSSAKSKTSLASSYRMSRSMQLLNSFPMGN